MTSRRPNWWSCPVRRLADDYFSPNEPNLNLVVNAVQWLGNRPDLQGLAPRRREVLAFRVDPDLRARLIALPTVLSLGVIVAAGVATCPWLAGPERLDERRRIKAMNARTLTLMVLFFAGLIGLYDPGPAWACPPPSKPGRGPAASCRS